MEASDARPQWQIRLLSVWQRRGIASALLRPVSMVFGVLVALRHSLYRCGVLKTTRLPVTVVVVGNVVVGGGGKTPVVIALAEHLRSRGIAVGVISRGYGRRGRDQRKLEADSLADEVGDEPLLIFRRTGVPVWVGPDRAEAAKALLAEFPQTEILLCDDGMQDLALGRHLEVCVFGSAGIGNGLLLPAGPLREPWPSRWTTTVPRLFLHAGSQGPRGPASFQMHRTLDPELLRADGTRLPLGDLAGRQTCAVAAIANPQAFFAMLEQAGLRPGRCIALADHASLKELPAAPQGTTDWICTEKDATKIWAHHPEVWAARLNLHLEPGFLETFDSALDLNRGERPVSLGHGHSTA